MKNKTNKEMREELLVHEWKEDTGEGYKRCTCGRVFKDDEDFLDHISDNDL